MTQRHESVTIPVRVPDELYADVRRWAQIKGITPGDLLREAWDAWVVAHKDEILAQIDAFRADVAAR